MKCPLYRLSISHFFDARNAINESPSYQREGGAWRTEKKGLFLDTLFHGYDSPKIYFHVLTTNGGTHNWALVDGKQRLECIWDFMDGKIPLNPDFEYTPTDNYGRKQKPYPKAKNYFNDLSKYWQAYFKAINLDVIYIEDAEEADIEELFSRLNNGETLKAPEKRNSMGGKMPPVIRILAQKNKFFTNTIAVKSTRYQHLDIAARFLLIEKGIKDGAASPYRDIKKRFLDKLVQENRNMKDRDIDDLKKRVEKQLNSLSKVFGKKDVLLRQAGYVQLYYLFVKHIETYYASKSLFTDMKKFIAKFDRMRQEAKAEREEAKVNPSKRKLLPPKDDYGYMDELQRIEERGEFERLMRQGNDKESLKTRVQIMSRFFLLDYPSTTLRDKKRNFTEEERYAVYVIGGKKCALCGEKFLDFDAFEADHVIQWAHGGKSNLNNAQALCKSCNARKNKKVA